jgi:copper(I)-binding protein
MMPAMRTKTLLGALAAALAIAGVQAQAHDYKAGGVRVGHPYATPSIPGAPNGAAYLATLENGGAIADRLLRASTPVAARVELHTMAMDGGVMRMREVEGVPIGPKETVTMRPGQGFHLMLMQLKAPLKAGDTFPLTLEFEKGGKVEVRVDVQQPRDPAAAHKH